MKKLFNLIIMFYILLFAGSSIAECNGGKSQENRLIVTGYGKTKVVANIAEVRLSTEMRDANAKNLQNNLASISTAVSKALKHGKTRKVETEQIFITPNYSKNDPQTLLGFTGRISIIFEAQAKDAGQLISDSIKAGANRIDRIWLKPSEEVQIKANLKALELASKDALRKAETILKSLNLTQTAIKRVNANARPIFPYHATSARGFADAKIALQSVAPEVSEKEQIVEAEITLIVGYEE